MTLEFKIGKVELNKTRISFMRCYVSGGKAGDLKSDKAKNDGTWNPAFEVRCACDDKLLFYISNEEDFEEQSKSQGEASFVSSSFIKNHKKLRKDTPFECRLVSNIDELDLLKDEVVCGKLHMQVYYDKVKKY